MYCTHIGMFCNYEHLYMGTNVHTYVRMCFAFQFWHPHTYACTYACVIDWNPYVGTYVWGVNCKLILAWCLSTLITSCVMRYSPREILVVLKLVCELMKESPLSQGKEFTRLELPLNRKRRCITPVYTEYISRNLHRETFSITDLWMAPQKDMRKRT